MMLLSRPTTSLAIVLAGFLATPALHAADATPPTRQQRAVVLVSGGATTTPFTTPTQACKDGDGFLAAGNTYTALRRHLLSQGKRVFTAPVMDTWGPVQEPAANSLGPFTGCPLVLPETMTILSTGDIPAGGERLARFLGYLNTHYGITDVDLVGHSNGGLWSRSAIWVLKNIRSPIRVRSLTAIGTPHVGSVPGRYTVGEISLATCKGNAYCINALKQWIGFADKVDKGLNREDSEKFLSGPDGWNAAQGNALEGIPVTLMAGTYFQEPKGDPTVWPYDGTSSRFSAWASTVPDTIIPWRTCWQAPLVHTIYQSDSLKIPWNLSITDNNLALARVNQAIDDADTALKRPNRQGCMD